MYNDSHVADTSKAVGVICMQIFNCFRNEQQFTERCGYSASSNTFLNGMCTSSAASQLDGSRWIAVDYFQELFNLNSFAISNANLIFHISSAPHVDGLITNSS